MTATTAATGCPRTAIDVELVLWADRLTEARLRQAHKDSTGHRASVAECRARIDAILDLYLEGKDPDR
jgi:hypothetical protein